MHDALQAQESSKYPELAVTGTMEWMPCATLSNTETELRRVSILPLFNHLLGSGRWISDSLMCSSELQDGGYGRFLGSLGK